MQLYAAVDRFLTPSGSLSDSCQLLSVPKRYSFCMLICLERAHQVLTQVNLTSRDQSFADLLKCGIFNLHEVFLAARAYKPVIKSTDIMHIQF